MTRHATPVVDVQVVCGDPDIPPVLQIKSWITRTIVEAAPSVESGAEVSVRLIDKQEMRALNRDYRKKDAVTNVLSFPAGEIEGLPQDAARTLGDIVICAAVVSMEAAEQGKKVADHWAHMLVHGTLHLLGYDHEADDEAAEMEALETRILVSNGLSDPYLES